MMWRPGVIVLLTAVGISPFLTGCESPTYLPLENFGITDYKVLDADTHRGMPSSGPPGTTSEDLRYATLTVSTPKTSQEELRLIARDIKADEDYGGYDILELYFTERLREDLPLKAYAVVVLSEEGRKVVKKDHISSGSKDGDGILFYELPPYKRS
jgi:hypothetical protein